MHRSYEEARIEKQHPDFQLTRDGIWKSEGFYVLMSILGTQQHVFCSAPKLHGEHTQSYYITSKNDRDDIEHDFGLYGWAGGYDHGRYGALAWRRQTEAEELETRQSLYRFDRKRKPWPQ